ncbi:hypothetical protein FOA52_010471 [Chlamydomonas sp. UWO 241]|nr:hypothetical protein FOA52_010471 [Chlamydomonas sp. UWO 241]
MYNSQATVSWWMWVLHVTMVIFGGFLIINLTIAVIFINFNKAYSGSSSSIPDSGYDDEGAGKGSAEHGGEARVLAHLDSTWDAGASGRQDDQAVSAGAATGDVPVRPSALRRAWERVRDYCYIIQCSKWFEHTTTGMIIANAIVLALVWYNMPAQLALATMYLNYFFTMYFFVEMLIKLAGLGPVVYVQDPMNCFDGVVTIAGVIEFILSVVPSVTGLGGVMSVFRAFRLLRILRLARHWKSLRRIIAVMFSSLQSVSWLTVLLFLFLFIAGLLGMSFFGYKLSYCEIDGAEQICPPGLTFEECPATLDCYIACDQTLELQWYEVDGSPYGDQAYCEVFPRTPVVGMVPTYWAQVGQAATLTANYDSIGGAIITVFVLLTADNYDVNMKETMVLAGPWLSALFTIGVMIFGIFMILNLFLALLLSNLDQLDEEDMSSTASTMADDDAANGEARERAGADNALEPGAERDRDRIRERPWGTRSFTGGGNGQGHGFADDGQSLYLPKASALRQKTALGGLNQQDGGGVYIWPPADGIGDGGGGGAGSDFGTPRSEDSGSVLIGTKPQSSGGVDSPQEAHGLKPYHHLPAITSAYYGGQVVPLPLALSVPLLPPDANAARRPGGGRGVSFGGMHAGSGDRERVVASSGSESRLAGRTLSHARLVRPLGFGEHPPEQQPEAPQLEGYALFVFSPTNPIRTGLFSLISNKWFEYTMLVLILASSLALCFDDASAKKGTQKAEALYVMDIIFCVSFGVEAVMKMIVYGVAFNGKGSYVRDGWNLLDLFVVVVQVLVLILEAVTKNSNLVWLRAFRAIRALRPVRAAAQIEGIRVVVLAMFLAAPAVAEVMLVATLFYFIFAVLGVELFMGKFFLCSSDGNQLDPYYLLSSGNINKTWCNTDDGQQTITTSYYHSALGVDVPPWTLDTKWGDNGNLNRFDNVIMALWVLIQMATLENWSDVMYQAMQTTGVNEQPLQGANNIVSIYFLIFVIFGSFFILNLVIGVSIDKFNKLKKSQGGKSLLLTGKQQDWLTIQRMMANTKPKPRYPVPANPIRRVCHTIALSNAFDVAMVAVILANIISMFMVHEGQSVEWDNALKIANAVFTGIYIVEMFMKQAAIGFRAYFHDGWCIFDFVVVVVSVTGVICDYATTADLSFILLLRVLRVLRIIKLIPKAKGLKMLMMTLLWSLPALGNVALVLFMFMFIYAIIGMNLFGNIKLQESIIFMANFRDFPTSMLLLFRMTTIENWNALMWDCMQKEDCMLVDATVDVTATDGTVTTWWAGTYLDPVSDADTLDSIPDWAILNECSPAPVLAAFYFVTYMMVVVYLMVQLVIGIILENIETHARIDNMKVKQQHIQDFLETWEDLDPKGSSYIPVATLTSLLQAVGPPVGVKGAGNVSLRVQAIVQDINIPVRASGGVQSIHFMETLHALAGRVAGQNLPAEEEFTIHNRMVARLPKDELPPKYSVADFYAALHVKASIQGFLVRRRLMPMLHEITEGLRPSPAIVAKPDKSGIFAKFAPGEDDEGTGAGNASRRLLQRTTTFITDMFRSKSQVVPEPQPAEGK